MLSSRSFKFKCIKQLVRFYWWFESVIVDLPHYRQRQAIFFGPAILIPIIISAASFAANYAISYFMRPKQKPQVKGKLTGDLTLTDSIHGAPIVRVYGG